MYARALKVSVAVVVDRHVPQVWKERTCNFVAQIIANLWVFGIDSIGVMGEPLFEVFAHESSVVFQTFATQVWL